MLVGRRQFMLSAFIAAAFGSPNRGFAAGDQALFWRIKTRDDRSGIVFGYARVAASLAPSVVRDGERMVEQTSRLVLDMNDFTLPTLKLGKFPPLLPRLSQPVAAELREVLSGSGMAQPQLESLWGVLVAFFLMGEGQTNPVPSVGAVIVDRARARRRSITTLLTEGEVKQMIKPIDGKALNDTIDEKMITFMLELRRQVGPIGAHGEKLYCDRKSEELYRFSEDLARHGVPGTQSFLEYNPDLLFSRISDSLTTSEGFFLAPVGTLTGPDGILERFRRQGADISVLA